MVGSGQWSPKAHLVGAICADGIGVMADDGEGHGFPGKEVYEFATR
jgi:hypothetical protein